MRRVSPDSSPTPLPTRPERARANKRTETRPAEGASKRTTTRRRPSNDLTVSLAGDGTADRGVGEPREGGSHSLGDSTSAGGPESVSVPIAGGAQRGGGAGERWCQWAVLRVLRDVALVFVPTARHSEVEGQSVALMPWSGATSCTSLQPTGIDSE